MNSKSFGLGVLVCFFSILIVVMAAMAGWDNGYQAAKQECQFYPNSEKPNLTDHIYLCYWVEDKK